jgi:N-acetylmuramoyl-L-alanine amidase
MKQFTAVFVLALLVALPASAATNPLEGKIIALDSGHGGVGEGVGAVNVATGVTEADVNWEVTHALEAALSGQGARVVVAARLATRKDRVNDAIAKCAALDLNSDGVADGKKCDVLVSVHHNGSSDPSHDGTLVIYNEKQDIPLATALHDSLLAGLGLTNEGYLSGGYGVTVYGHLVSALTEAYYITNDEEAAAWLAGTRTPQEVAADVAGLTAYFAAQSSGGKGGKGRGG